MSTEGLATLFILEEGARIMLTSNIDVRDKLNTGQIGNVHCVFELNGKESIVYVKFDDLSAGVELTRGDYFADENNVVPIRKLKPLLKFVQII